MKLFFDKHPTADIAELLSSYRAEDLASPTRSTVPLLSLFKQDGQVLEAVLGSLIDGSDGTEAHFEFTVDPPKGVGKASHTDAMLLRSGQACAIEAKWTEPPYADVRSWIAEGKNPGNRKDVLAGWLSLLQPLACKPLRDIEFGDVTYQMVHRAASACASGSPATLAYLQFSPLPSLASPCVDELRKGLGRLKGLLGVECALRIHLVEVRLKPTAAFDQIRTLPKGTLEAAQEVKLALQAEPLFEFLNVEHHSIEG